MDSKEVTGAMLFEEAQRKTRTQLQSYLKGNGYAAKGTTELLRSNYLQARKIECGMIDETLAWGALPQKKPAAKKKRVMITAAEKELNADAKKGWHYSDAKAALTAAIMEGQVPLEAAEDEDQDDLMGYFEGIPNVFSYGGFEKFKKRLNDLRNQLRDNKTRAEEDLEAYMIYCKNHGTATNSAKGDYPEWEGSEAQNLLRYDLENGVEIEKKPKELWLSRAAFQKFPLKVFREHIYQIGRTQKYLKQVKKMGKGGNRWKDFRKDGNESLGSDDSISNFGNLNI
jgi:hypothetical protein